MTNKVKVLSFFIVMFFAFGITFLDFNNLVFDQDLSGYIAIGIGIILAIFHFIIQKKNKKALE